MRGNSFEGPCTFAALFGVVSLAAPPVCVFTDAAGWIDWQFITGVPSSEFPHDFTPAAVAVLLTMGVVAKYMRHRYTPEAMRGEI
jgi:hypothetical protein